MKGAIYAILGVICAVVAAYFIYAQVIQKDINIHTNLIIAIPFLILALVFVGIFFAGRVNQEEEIHITK